MNPKSFISNNKKFFIGILGITAFVSGVFARRVQASSETTSELAKMYEVDQNDRTSLSAEPSAEQWATITAHDKLHHDRVLELMRDDKLNSADDYYYAAMIMQHGQESKDYMLAHILATAAAVRGNESAIWLSAASFDRLMQSTGQPQVFGTQYFAHGSNPYAVSEPMDLDLITDSVRKAFNVPTLEDNQERLKFLNSRENRD